MKYLYICVGLFLVTLFFYACNFNSTNYNIEDDKIDAEAITNSFYKHIKEKNYDQASLLFGLKFYKTTTEEQLKLFLQQLNNNFGNYKSNELLKWNTSDTKGTNNGKEYVLKYKVVYDKFTATETISLELENNVVKIVGYNVDSFVQKQ